MSTKSRSDRIQLLHKVVTKHFTPVPQSDDRSVLENLIYGCCLEDADYEQADEAFHRLQESFFDWNEVRVTTITELCETVHNLPDPPATAVRVKKNLQSLFESRYSFDLEDMVKMNQGKAVQELENLAGMSKFVLGYMVQNSLGGHSIPVSKSIMDVLLMTEIVTEAEAAKWMAPGLERTVPKTKGAAFSSCLHQFAVGIAASPGSQKFKAILKEAGGTEKKAKKPAAKKATKKAAKKKTPAPEAEAVEAPASKPSKKAAKKTSAKAAVAKNTPAKAPAKKSASKKASPKAAEKKSAKRKPR